jgi:hypothetical protein
VNVENRQEIQLSVPDFVSELSDIATGAAIMTFALAPFALPFLALVAAASVALLVPVLACALIAGSCMVALRWCRLLSRSVSRRRVPESPDRRLRRCDRDAFVVSSMRDE